MEIDEGEVRRILSHPMLSQKVQDILGDKGFLERLGSIVGGERSFEKIKSLMEKEHTAQCLLLLYIDRQWREARNFMSNGAFRARMLEMKELGLTIEDETIPHQSSWMKTVVGNQIAQLLLQFLKEER